MNLKLTKKSLIESLIGIALLIGGLLLLVWSYSVSANADFAGNVWNRMIYTIFATSLISAGYAMTWNGYKKITWFIITFVLLNAGLALMGGVLSFNAIDPEYNSFLIAYQTGFTDFGLGIKLIGDAVSTIVPLILLCLIIYQVLYSGEADENMKGLLEGGVCLVFILAFNFVGGLELGTLLALYTPSYNIITQISQIPIQNLSIAALV